MPVAVRDLKDIALDWAIAFCTDMTDIDDFTSSLPEVRMFQHDDGSHCLSAGWRSETPPFDWSPQTDWNQLGALIDKYGMCYSYTARDHESEAVSAFCPGFPQGRAYGHNIKEAMLRSLVNQRLASDEVKIPIDILKVSKTWVHPEIKAMFAEFPLPEEVAVEPYEFSDF
ncbi:hypothetical protein D3C75_1021130 [compost metagenome]